MTDLIIMPIHTTHGGSLEQSTIYGLIVITVILSVLSFTHSIYYCIKYRPKFSEVSDIMSIPYSGIITFTSILLYAVNLFLYVGHLIGEIFFT